MMGETPVYLGRFCPFHSGHELVLRSLIQKFGRGRVLVIIGSSRFITPITPYTYDERKSMISTLFPGIKIIPLPDTHNRPKVLNDPNNKIWLERIRKIEKKMNTRFVFYGGSKKDLEILAGEFPTRVIFNRKSKGLGISGTKIREALAYGDTKFVKKFVNPKILKIIIGNN